jgi:uncharacterized integral membrane protein (TIGR00697 family)
VENPKVDPQAPTRYLELITGLFAGFLLISNLASTRIIQVGFLSFDAGTLIFPLTYIFGDLLTEVYGFQKSRKVIWTGFLTLFLATILLHVTSLFPASPEWEGDSSWQAVMGLVPRLALGSLLAYLIGEFANSMTLAKMKAKAPHKGPALRFVVSTLVGQFFDTFIFALIAFLGVLESGLWWKLVGSNYLFKVGVEIILLPLTILIVRRLKKSEGLDPVDKNISLNPFKFKETPTKAPLATEPPKELDKKPAPELDQEPKPPLSPETNIETNLETISETTIETSSETTSAPSPASLDSETATEPPTESQTEPQARPKPDETIGLTAEPIQAETLNDPLKKQGDEDHDPS